MLEIRVSEAEFDVARIRTIKPKFFTDEDLAELAFSDRLLFVGLWTQADKAGRLEDRPKRLKAELFPYDDLDMDDALGRLANAKFITRYEGNGKRLIQVRTWHRHQRPPKSEPESELPAIRISNDPDPIENVSSRLEGKGREGKEEGNGSHALSRGTVAERFESFWTVYPRKVGKDAALRIWLRLKPSDEMTARIIAAVYEQAKSAQWLKDGGQFIPHPRTWLNQGRWQDEAVAAPFLKTQTTNNAKAIDEWLNRPLAE